MLSDLNRLFTGSAFALVFSALVFPAYVSAASFFPTSDIDINLTADTTFNFDSYTISPGINVSYLAPENSLIEIISDGDIIIDGALSFFGGATYSFTSSNGAIYLNGSLNIFDNISLIFNSGLFVDAGAGAGSSGTGSGVSLTNGANNPVINFTGTTTNVTVNNTILPFNGDGLIIQNTSPTTTGTISLNPNIIGSGVTFTVQLTPVPVPPALILFLTGLMTLAFGLKRSTKKLNV